MKKLHGSNKQVFVAPIKTTSEYVHYVAYLLSLQGLRLIAPCSDEKEAKEVGMNYNKTNSGLPPYTFKVHYSNKKDRLKNALSFTLSKMNVKGNVEIHELSGYHEFSPMQVIIKP